jgi:hypothetical protein
MKTFFNKVGRFFKQVTAFLPTPLPKGMTAFDSWATEVLSLVGEGIPDNDSTRWALAASVINLPSTTDSKPKMFFVRTIRAAAAKQVAAEVFQTLKLKQKAEMEATMKKDASNAGPQVQQ